MKSFKDYCQEVDEGWMGYGSDAGGSMLDRHTSRVRTRDSLARNYLVGKGKYPDRKPRQHHSTYNAEWEKHKENLQAKKDADKSVIGKTLSKAKVALHKKVYGIHPTVTEDLELDEGIYLVGTYSNPKKEHIRVWQHSPAGYHYSIENTKNKKILQHHGSLESAVSRHKLELVKEEEEKREFAPNVPTWIRNRAEKRYGHYVNVVGKTEAVRRKKYKQDHDDEAAIERAAARRKGW